MNIKNYILFILLFLHLDLQCSDEQNPFKNIPRAVLENEILTKLDGEALTKFKQVDTFCFQEILNPNIKHLQGIFQDTITQSRLNRIVKNAILSVKNAESIDDFIKTSDLEFFSDLFYKKLYPFALNELKIINSNPNLSQYYKNSYRKQLSFHIFAFILLFLEKVGGDKLYSQIVFPIIEEILAKNSNDYLTQKLKKIANTITFNNTSIDSIHSDYKWKYLDKMNDSIDNPLKIVSEMEIDIGARSLKGRNAIDFSSESNENLSNSIKKEIYHFFNSEEGKKIFKEPNYKLLVTKYSFKIAQAVIIKDHIDKLKDGAFNKRDFNRHRLAEIARGYFLHGADSLTSRLTTKEVSQLILKAKKNKNFHFLDKGIKLTYRILTNQEE